MVVLTVGAFEVSISFHDFIALLLIEGLLAAIGGYTKGICDRIAHHDKCVKMGKWWSRHKYYYSKSEFIENHPWWGTTTEVKVFPRMRWSLRISAKAKTWFVNNVIVMVLDAWHFHQAIDMIADSLVWTIPCFVIFGWWFTPLVVCYLCYQISFRMTYE